GIAKLEDGGAVCQAEDLYDVAQKQGPRDGRIITSCAADGVAVLEPDQLGTVQRNHLPGSGAGQPSGPVEAVVGLKLAELQRVTGGRIEVELVELGQRLLVRIDAAVVEVEMELLEFADGPDGQWANEAIQVQERVGAALIRGHLVK